MRYSFNGDSDQITIHRIDDTTGEHSSAQITADDPMFAQTKSALLEGKPEDAFEYASREFIAKAVNLVNGVHFDGARIQYEHEGMWYDADGVLADRIMKAVADGNQVDATRLSAFMKRLLTNPSPQSISELFLFIQAENIKITDDGYFLAFKRVRQNYFDVHSNTFDNSVGKEPSMPRHLVDADRNSACSRGLHVCSEGYLGSFGNGPVMMVRVDPRDVVSVPADHRDEKMRVCRYKVVSEITGLDELGRAKENFSAAIDEATSEVVDRGVIESDLPQAADRVVYRADVREQDDVFDVADSLKTLNEDGVQLRQYEYIYRQNDLYLIEVDDIVSLEEIENEWVWNEDEIPYGFTPFGESIVAERLRGVRCIELFFSRKDARTQKFKDTGNNVRIYDLERVFPVYGGDCRWLLAESNFDHGDMSEYMEDAMLLISEIDVFSGNSGMDDKTEEILRVLSETEA